LLKSNKCAKKIAGVAEKGRERKHSNRPSKVKCPSEDNDQEKSTQNEKGEGGKKKGKKKKGGDRPQ